MAIDNPLSMEVFVSWVNQLLLSIIITGNFPAPVCDYRVIAGYNLGGFADEWGIGTTQMTWVIGKWWSLEGRFDIAKQQNPCQPLPTICSKLWFSSARKRTFQADVSETEVRQKLQLKLTGSSDANETHLKIPQGSWNLTPLGFLALALLFFFGGGPVRCGVRPPGRIRKARLVTGSASQWKSQSENIITLGPLWLPIAEHLRYVRFLKICLSSKGAWWAILTVAIFISWVCVCCLNLSRILHRFLTPWGDVSLGSWDVSGSPNSLVSNGFQAKEAWIPCGFV